MEERMADRPKVSVIVPAYNAEQYLRECLDSLLAQSFGNIEIICVNDGSTDSTSAIIDEYRKRDSRVRVIDKPNSGYGHSMNVGMDAARGEWLASVDADDYVAPNAYERMLAVAEENHLDFLKTDRAYFCDGKEGRTFRRSPISRDKQHYQMLLNPSVDPWRSSIKPGQPGFYRIRFLRDHGIRHNETPGASFQDTGFYAQVLFWGSRVMLLEDETYLVREDNPGRSTCDSSKVYCICDEYDFIREKASKVPEERRAACLKSAAAMRFEGYVWNESRLAPVALSGFVKRAHEDFARLRAEGEVDESYFSAAQWAKLCLLLENPMEYYARFCFVPVDDGVANPRVEVARLKARIAKADNRVRELQRQNDALKERVGKLKTSNSYRIGRVVTAPVRALKRMVCKKGGK